MANKRPPAKSTVHRPPPTATPTVCVAFIHPGECSAYFTTSLLGSMLYDQATDRHITGIINEWSSANVSAARNSLTAKFLDEKTADWLLWIDADMGWDHYAVHQIVTAAHPTERPIVGGLCFGKIADALFPTIYQLADSDGKPTTIRVNEYAPDSLVKCFATGAAFLLIHRTVLERMRERKFNETFPWFQETELAGQPCGEDITFCLRAGLLDIPVHVDTAVKIGHHKSHLLTEDLFQTQRQEA